MYHPVSPRRKLTNITRTRTGCYTCRRRRKRCDETKPKCGACSRLEITCEGFEPRFKFLCNTPSTTGDSPKPRTNNESSEGRWHRSTQPRTISDTEDDCNQADMTLIPTSLGITVNQVPVVTIGSNPPSEAHHEIGEESSLRSNADIVDWISCNSPYIGQTKIAPRLTGHNLDHGYSSSKNGAGFQHDSYLSYALDDRTVYSYPSIDLKIFEKPQYLILQDRLFTSASEQESPVDDQTRVLPATTITSPSNSASDQVSSNSNLETLSQGYKPSSVFRTTNYSSTSPSEASFNQPKISTTQKQTHPPYRRNHWSLVSGESQAPIEDLTTPARQIDNHQSSANFIVSHEKLYLRHWSDVLKDNLPDVFKDVAMTMGSFPALRHAIIALSACNLGQTQPGVREIVRKNVRISIYSPREDHQLAGQKYYNLAIRDLAMAVDLKSNPLTTLATLLLFIYIESEVGSFRGLAFHHHGIERLLASEYETCLKSNIGKGLIYTWVGLRAISWKFRIPFTVFRWQKEVREMGINLDEVLTSPTARNEAVVANMVDSWHLSLMVLFERYVGHGDLESISSRCSRDYSQRLGKPATAVPWRPNVSIPDENYISLLKEQQSILEKWHSALPLSDLPIDSFINRSDLSASTDNEESQPSYMPLRFQSHHAAMNYVYYVCANILQSVDILNNFLSRPANDDIATSTDPTNRWLSILLRIVAGLDMVACIRHNLYTIGIIEVLYSVLLRLPGCSVIIRKTLHSVVQQLTDLCASREGSSHLPIILELFDMIEHEREKDNDIFLILSGSSDVEWETQWDESKLKVPTIVYGRNRARGKIFCKRLH